MTDASTTGAVERLAQHYDERVAMHDSLVSGVLGNLRQERGKETRDFHKATADTLRALVAERDAAIQRAQTAEAQAALAWMEGRETCAQHVDAGIYMGSDGKGFANIKAMTGDYLRSLTPPADLSAALTARLDAEHNAAIEAADKAAIDRQGRRAMGDGHGNSCYDIGVSDAASAIRALRRAAPTEGEAQSLDDTTRAVLDRAERIVAGQSQQEQRTAEIFLRPTEGEA